MLDTGIRGQVLTTKYSIVYMEKEAWPEKKDFLQEQERAVNGPYSHSCSMFVCLSSLPRLWPWEQHYLVCLYAFYGAWDKLPGTSRAPMNAWINEWMQKLPMLCNDGLFTYLPQLLDCDFLKNKNSAILDHQTQSPAQGLAPSRCLEHALWTACIEGAPTVMRDGVSPGFLDFAVIASAFVVLNIALRAVDQAEIRAADAQEMRTQASYGDFGNVCEGLANGTAKEEATHLLVEGCHVRILNRWPGLLLQVIDPVELPCDDLKGNQ